MTDAKYTGGDYKKHQFRAWPAAGYSTVLYSFCDNICYAHSLCDIYSGLGFCSCQTQAPYLLRYKAPAESAQQNTRFDYLLQ